MHTTLHNHLPRFVSISIGAFLFLGCISKTEQKQAKTQEEYIWQIPGQNEHIAAEIAQKGEVLIAYSDCYTCHKIDKRGSGPSFRDIAKRYPANKAYIEMLAHKVISGGNRSWGYPMMSPHPKLRFEDAKLMVSYILSLKENS